MEHCGGPRGDREAQSFVHCPASAKPENERAEKAVAGPYRGTGLDSECRRAQHAASSCNDGTSGAHCERHDLGCAAPNYVAGDRLGSRVVERTASERLKLAETRFHAIDLCALKCDGETGARAVQDETCTLRGDDSSNRGVEVRWGTGRQAAASDKVVTLACTNCGEAGFQLFLSER
jgi:hypothetical protein